MEGPGEVSGPSSRRIDMAMNRDFGEYVGGVMTNGGEEVVEEGERELPVSLSVAQEVEGETEGEGNGRMVNRLLRERICVIPRSSSVWGEVAV